jgi:predicted amidohydrolase YtcJ
VSDLVITGADLGGRYPQRVRLSAGRISAVGPDLPIAAADRVLDAAGGAVLPGLHDHHVHLYATAAARESVRLGPPEVDDRDRFGATLRNADRNLPDGAWLRGVAYHESVAGPLDRHALDTLVPGRPVRVQHRSGSQWILNTRALEALSVSSTDDRGIERDAGGVPTGRLTRMDRWLAGALGREPLGLAQVSEDAARVGITGFTDATPFSEVGQIGRLADSAGRREVRQRLSVMTAPEARTADAGNLHIGPVKILLDDATLPDFDDFRRTVALSHRVGRAVAVHCVTRVQLVLTTAVLEDVGATPADRIEHGSVIPAEVIPTLAKLGVTVVTNPGFIYDRGDTYRSEVAPADQPSLYRCATLRAAGVGVAAGTDAPFGPPDPWAAARAGTWRETRSGAVLGPLERIDAASSLSLFFGSADAPARPRTVSSGALGDLCVLFTPRRESLRELRAENVAATVVAGEVIADNR